MFAMPFRRKNYFFFMSWEITTDIYFKIACIFEKCLKIFYSKEANLRHSEFDIKQLLREFIINDPKKSYLHTWGYRGKYSEVWSSN